MVEQYKFQARKAFSSAQTKAVLANQLPDKIKGFSKMLFHRQNILSIKNEQRNLMNKLPLTKVNPSFDQSPRDYQTTNSEQKLSSRANNHNGGGGSSTIQSQRKNVPVLTNNGKNTHHLAFRRHQVMDITDDANTNSYNKLTIQNEGDGSSIEALENKDGYNNHSQPPPAYNIFYHTNQDSNRYDPKKSIRVLKQQSKIELSSSLLKQNQENPQQQQLFQFTRKQNLIGENSVSSTREKIQNQFFKVKKTNGIGNLPAENSQVPSIGKRKPLIIRKNNFIQTNNSGINPINESHSTSNNNLNTILTGMSNRFNNTNNLNATGGNMSEASQSQTRYGITQLLKSLNSTTQSNDLQASLHATNQSLKESKLFKINQSKKKLDTARKSRIQQLQQDQGANTTASILIANNNSISQQPPEVRNNNQPPLLSAIAQKKRSFIVPKVKVDNSGQIVQQQFNPVIQTPQNKVSARENTNRNTAQTTSNISQQLLQNVYMNSNSKRLSHPAEEISTTSNDQSSQPQKYIKRGQILRMMKQKQQETVSQNQSIPLDSSLERQQQNQNSLNRVESKKDLGTMNKEGGQSNQLIQKSQHFVKEELIIHENINDSSCTPKDHSFAIQNDQAKQQQKNTEQMKKELDEKSDQQTQIQLIIIKDGDNEDLIHEEVLQPQQVIDALKKQETFNDSQAQTRTQTLNIQKTAPQSTEAKPKLNQRHYNHSQNTIKSPVGTATSFKSQNSQQAGPNPDEIVFPMKPGKALKLFMKQLTDYEMGEILDYQEIYYLGLNAKKVQGSPRNEHNCGYDDEKGDYKIIINDHIGYRYEVISFIGKGSFGTALKCFDHKNKEEVALKIVKNKKKYQYQAGIELKILNFLKENDQDDIMNVIHMKDYVIFRKHLCISFELLSMNLFEFLKINDFNGFDHNLIRRFAIQLLYALKYLKEFQIIHCDLKPENILLKEANKSGIKIIDFGSSTFIDERVYTYIQSRFYRAPEIMLGIPYTCAIDMWSFGCIMAELYIGYPIFPGESENDQMSRIIEMVNIPSREVYEVSQRRSKFFNENTKGDYEPIMLPNSRGKLRIPGGKPLSLLIGDEDPDFLDFVEKCLEWNPETRMSPDDALRHIWVLKGLPPQVLIHHQRMHNITTPELPDAVRLARDKFFLEATIQNDNASQLAGRETQQTQQSSNSKTIQSSTAKNKNQQQKTETLKSLERAQIKNQLTQINHNKQHQNQIVQPKNNALVLHSKLNPQDNTNISKVKDESKYASQITLTSNNDTSGNQNKQKRGLRAEMVKKFSWYPAEDEKKHQKKTKPKGTKLRRGLVPGSVLIVLSGRFRGKRVVFLKQLTSGLLLVTGPYKVNGVPLKRVNQAYTITTSTKVNLNGVDVSKVDDALFKREKKSKKQGEDKFFAESGKKKEVSAGRLEAQKSVDTAILKNIKESKEPLLRKYLNARFSLGNNDKVHELHF